MKIQNITPQQHQQQLNRQNEEQPRFTGAMEAATGALRFFETNQAWGANAVDLGSMVIPRTWTDMRKRGPQAGTETFIRESCGTFNHSMVGVYGTVAGLALATLFNKKYEINAHRIFADNSAIDILAKDWHDVVQNHFKNGGTFDIDLNKGGIRIPRNVKEEYADRITGRISTFNNGYKPIADADKSKVKNTIVEVLEQAEDINNKKLSKAEKKQVKNFLKEKTDYLVNVISESTGGKESARLLNDTKSSSGTLRTTVQNIFNVSRTFVKSKVVDTFINTDNIAENAFVKGLKSLNLKRSALGLGFAALFGMSVQPVNRYLTKKRTGSDGFVGVEGRKKDDSKSFAVQKVLTGLILGTGALATITTKPSKFLSKLQFKGMTPTINQLKFVYGMTIMSRLFAARDKDELRESAIKDTLGFLNLLILGSLVTKGAVMAMDKSKSLLNTAEKSKNVFKRFINSSVKTKDEVLVAGLKNHGISTIGEDGKALKFSKMIELLPKADKLTRGKLNVLNLAQLIGYAYSALVLGVGIPRLNIYMTNKREARNAAMRNANIVTPDSTAHEANNEFLKSKMVNFYGNRAA